MMFGIGADDQGTITAHLEKSFNNVEVLNAGTPGYGLDQVYLKAKTMMKRFSPDVLLVGLITHDLDRLTTRHFSGAKPVFKKVDEKWTLTGSPVPTRQQRLKRQLPLIIALPKLLLDISLRPSPSETDETIAELGEWLILEMRREAQKQNARPIFVLMPWRFELDPTNCFYKPAIRINWNALIFFRNFDKFLKPMAGRTLKRSICKKSICHQKAMKSLQKPLASI
jgi:hypothetical protein